MSSTVMANKLMEHNTAPALGFGGALLCQDVQLGIHVILRGGVAHQRR